jgi:hypothetical protein
VCSICVEIGVDGRLEWVGLESGLGALSRGMGGRRSLNRESCGLQSLALHTIR